jgi:hypothetical protein
VEKHEMCRIGEIAMAFHASAMLRGAICTGRN